MPSLSILLVNYIIIVIGPNIIELSLLSLLLLNYAIITIELYHRHYYFLTSSSVINNNTIFFYLQVANSPSKLRFETCPERIARVQSSQKPERISDRKDSLSRKSLVA